VWNGTSWSDVTRPYGEAAVTPRLAANLGLVLAMRRVLDAGIVGVVGGLGLLEGVLAHWPGTAHPAPQWFALAGSDVAIAFMLIGTVVCAFGVKELMGRWSFEAFVPGVNLFVASALVTRRLGKMKLWRIVSEIILLVLFAISSRDSVWLFVGPAVVAYVETTWFGAIVDQLNGPSTIENNNAS
jgi:hypothetical protein